MEDDYYKGRSPLIERFVHAFRGIRHAWQKEPNFKIEVIFAIGALGTMAVLPLGGVKRAVLILVITFVLSLEMINSVFERLLNVLHPQFSPEVKRIKDTMAGVVLLASGTSVIIAGLLLVQPFLAFDRVLQQFLGSLRNSILVKIALWTTLLGGWRIVGGLSLGMALILFLKGRKKLLALLAGGVGIGFVLLTIIKLLVSRARPPGAELIEPDSLSFPSGHAFMGTIFWLTLGYIFTGADRRRICVWGSVTFIILLIAFSRIILSVHWFSDVVGGILLGTFWFLLWFGINKRLFKEK